MHFSQYFFHCWKHFWNSSVWSPKPLCIFVSQQNTSHKMSEKVNVRQAPFVLNFFWSKSDVQRHLNETLSWRFQSQLLHILGSFSHARPPQNIPVHCLWKMNKFLMHKSHSHYAFLGLFVNLSFCIFLIVVSFLGQNCPQDWSLFTNLKRNWLILNLSPQIVTHIQKIVFIYIFLPFVSTKGTNFMEIHFMETSSSSVETGEIFHIDLHYFRLFGKKSCIFHFVFNFIAITSGDY